MDPSNQIKRNYHSPKFPGSFSGISTYFQHSKGVNKINLKKELEKYPAYTKFLPKVHRHPRRRTLCYSIDDLWQADLLDVQRYKTLNKNFKWILLVVDCFSKMIFVRPLKSKNAKDVTGGFESIINDTKRVCKKLQTDQGREFFNEQFQKLMKSHNIIHYHSYGSTKASLAEAAIKTISARLYRYAYSIGKFKYIDVLYDIVDGYNRTKHKTIGVPPLSVTEENSPFIWYRAFGRYDNYIPNNKFNVGDLVRLSLKQKTFTKGGKARYSDEIFRIQRVKNTNPTTYYLVDLMGENILGSKYEQQLARVHKAENNDKKVDVNSEDYSEGSALV